MGNFFKIKYKPGYLLEFMVDVPCVLEKLNTIILLLNSYLTSCKQMFYLFVRSSYVKPTF
jgi:hypothetical protein